MNLTDHPEDLRNLISLITKKVLGQTTPEDDAALDAWLREDPRNETLLRELLDRPEEELGYLRVVDRVEAGEAHSLLVLLFIRKARENGLDPANDFLAIVNEVESLLRVFEMPVPAENLLLVAIEAGDKVGVALVEFEGEVEKVPLFPFCLYFD